MDRFKRSAVFPLIVIVLLVYLASQTLLDDSTRTIGIHYSQVVEAVDENPRAIERVVLRHKRGVTVERVDGGTWKVKNPNEASQVALERRLIDQKVPYDWTGGESVWWSLVTSLLPFALLLAFFVFLQSRKEDRVRLPEQAN